MPELLDFDKDLIHLQAAYKIQLKSLAEDMRALHKGLGKVDQELDASASDDGAYARFQDVVKGFLDTAEAQFRNLIFLYSEVRLNADSLSIYFGDDPSRYQWEQVISSLVCFIKMFKKACDENKQWADAEKEEVVEEEGGNF